jgi:glycosyltransferase involved in cell wall biosynthesis
MRVLYVMPAEGFGGAERQGVVHIANLPKLGVEVVAATGPGQPIQAELGRAGVTGYLHCREFPSLAVEAPGLLAALARPWIYLRSLVRTTRDLVTVARRTRVDVIFASRTFGWIVASLVGRCLGIPVVWRAGSFPSSRLQSLLLRHVVPLVAPSALVANSEAGRRVYANHMRVPTAVLPNGVDTDRFSPAHAIPRIRRELGLEHVPVIGLAARPAPEKGLSYLAEVARQVLVQFPEARVLIAGEFPWRRHYQDYFADLGVGKAVTFLGHVADVESFHASCDVVVLTSRRGSIEMSSNAVLEAMATGRPVVVTDVGAMSEVVEHGVNGFLAAPDDPTDFADRVIALLGDPGLRERLGAAARQSVLERHSQEAVTEVLASVLLAVRGLDWPVQHTVRIAQTGKEAA